MKKTCNKINNIQLADFRERTRTYKFLIILGITILSASFILPPIKEEGAAIRLLITKNYRGIYNSAFVGAAVSEILVIMLSLFGFYLVKGSIEHDMKTGISQIVAATPTSKIVYLLGKLFSNFIVLAVIVMTTALISLIVFFIRGEVFPVDLWKFISPFIIIVLPTMIIISAVAILFEVVSFLKGSFGNVVYFFLWSILMATIPSMMYNGSYKSYKDIFGIGIISKGLAKSCPETEVGLCWTYSEAHNIKTFLFEGIDWNTGFIVSRLIYLAVPFIIICIAALIFNRFDVANKAKIKNKKKTVNEEFKNNSSLVDAISINAAKLTVPEINFSFFNMVRAEFRLMVNGLRWWWVITALGLIVACIFSPIEVVQKFILPFTWIWPIAIWSSMGNREKNYNTNQIIFSSLFGNRGQLIASWVSGVLVTILTGSGMFVRLLIIGDFQGLVAFIVASMFISGLALMLGIWSDNRKLFELIYLLIWYVGPMNNMYYINFMGVLNGFTSITKIMCYFMISMIFLLLSMLGRNLKYQS